MDILNNIFNTLVQFMGAHSGLLIKARDYVQDNFGAPGLIAGFIFIASVSALLAGKLIKLSFDIIRYVALPSVAISFVASYFLPFSFMYILPLTVAVFSLLLIIKG